MRMPILGLLGVSLAACVAQDTKFEPVEKPKAMAAAVQKFLDDKGGYCLGKPDWPRLVADVDRRKHKPDALQMPVLERLGVVSGAPVSGDSPSIEYSLTAAGRKFYVDYPAAAAAGEGQAPPRPGDLCVAQLRVVKVTTWTPVEASGGTPTTTVSYTYAVAKTAPWTADAEFRRVFPLVAEILSSANQLEMMLPLKWTGRAWVAAVPAY